jgi:hypothetical protein
MAVAAIAPSLLLVPTVTFILVFPIYQIALAQGNGTQSVVPSSSLDTVIAGIVSGGVIGAAASLIGTYLNNRHNMNVKKQELEHDLDIELLKHRIECYSLIIKYTTGTFFNEINSPNLTKYKITEFADRLKFWINEEKGGLLMSNNTRRLYTDFYNKLVFTATEKVKKVDAPSTFSFSESEIQRILHAEFEFRMSLLHDVGVESETPES